MERIKIGLGTLVVCILVIVGPTAAFGSIIPLAEQAKDNAVAPDFSPVVEVVEGDWVLTPSRQNAGGATIPAADGKILPLAEQGKEHGVAPDYSPVIDIIEGEWVLTPLSNSVESDFLLLDASVALGIATPELLSARLAPEAGAGVSAPVAVSTFTVVPEPGTFLLVGLGGIGFWIRKRNCR